MQVTGRAYEWWRNLKMTGLGHRVWLVKGERRRSGPTVKKTYPDSSKRGDRRSGAVGDVPILLLRTDSLKDAAHYDLQREVPGPGYIHLPDWVTKSTLAELVSEKREPDGWHKIAKRNETWDLLIYADALWTHERCDRIVWENPPAWAAPWDKNSEVITSDQRRSLKSNENKKPVRPRKNFVNAWKGR